MSDEKRLSSFLTRTRTFRIAMVLAAIGTLIYWLFGLYVVVDSYEEWAGQVSAGFIVLAVLINVLIPLIVSACFLLLVAGLAWALNPKWKEKE